MTNPVRLPRNQAPLALLVDADAGSRQLYADYLRHAFFDIDEAIDGREALAKAISRHPDVIVTETRLPGLSGFDLCRLLRRDALTGDIPLIVVTADAVECDVQRARTAGADVVLVKPCGPEQLGTQIRGLLMPGHELRARSTAIRVEPDAQLTRANGTLEHVQAVVSRRAMRRVALSRAHQRHATITPPRPPPALICPTCDQPLHYGRSYIGGVSQRHSEQWDYFDCPACPGKFQYRQRTRKLRRVG